MKKPFWKFSQKSSKTIFFHQNLFGDTYFQGALLDVQIGFFPRIVCEGSDNIPKNHWGVFLTVCRLLRKEGTWLNTLLSPDSKGTWLPSCCSTWPFRSWNRDITGWRYCWGGCGSKACWTLALKNDFSTCGGQN